MEDIRTLNSAALASAPAPASAPAKPEHGLLRSRWLLLLLVFVLGVFVARLPATLASIPILRGLSNFIDPISEVQQLLGKFAVDAPDQAKLQRGAINGMLEATEDNYAEFVPPDDASEFSKELTGQFVGIGCQIEIKDGWLHVVSPIEDSPAYKAGIMPGDRISKIEDESTFGLSVDQCIKKLTGQAGAPVKVVIQREGKDLPMTIIREKIVSKSVRGVSRLDDDSGHWNYLLDPESRVAYIRLSQFTPTSGDEMAEALNAASEQPGRGVGAKPGSIGGLVIDLRNNPGGYLDAALEIADMFLDKGVMLTVRGRDGVVQGTFSASHGGDAPSFPIAILVNSGSASASEIVAGALSDHGRAVIIGQRTFGKGLVQTLHEVRSLPGAQVKFTTQRYYLPSGRLIQRMDDSTTWGVDPTPGFFVPLQDAELFAWAMYRRNNDVLRGLGAAHPEATAPEARVAWNDPEWVENTAKDKQLAVAIRAMRSRLQAGDWPKPGLENEEHGKIADAELKALERARTRMSKEFARVERRIETLEKQVATGKSPQKKDLWSDELDLTDGRLEVFDKAGASVVRLKITGRDLERWLEVADVKKSEE